MKLKDFEGEKYRTLHNKILADAGDSGLEKMPDVQTELLSSTKKPSQKSNLRLSISQNRRDSKNKAKPSQKEPRTSLPQNITISELSIKPTKSYNFLEQQKSATIKRSEESSVAGINLAVRSKPSEMDESTPKLINPKDLANFSDAQRINDESDESSSEISKPQVRINDQQLDVVIVLIF